MIYDNEFGRNSGRGDKVMGRDVVLWGGGGIISGLPRQFEVEKAMKYAVQIILQGREIERAVLDQWYEGSFSHDGYPQAPEKVREHWT